MEKGGNLGSSDGLPERRKKMGGLPLSVFLSFNDRNVHPDCPNARNPYHKCVRHCLDKIPSGNKLLDGVRSEVSSSEWEKVLERKEANPNCPNYSNPYHKCTNSCFEKIMEKRQDAVEEPGKIVNLTAVKNKGVSITAELSGVNPNCKYASNLYHRCDEFCFEKSLDSDHPKVMKPKEQKLVHIAERGVNSKCKNSSNPYHVCAEYCFQEVHERDSPGQGMKLKKLKERKKVASNTAIPGVNPNCRFASNRFHKCAEYCFQNGAEWDISDGALIKEKKKGPRKERKADHPVKEERSMDSDYIESPDTSHSYTDSSEGFSILVGTNESESVFNKEEKEVEASMIEHFDTQPLRIDATDLFQEWAKYCSLKASEDNEARTAQTVQREEPRRRREKG